MGDAFQSYYYFNFLKDVNKEKIDVMSLLTGLIIAGVFLVIFGLLGYYLCVTKCNRQPYPR